MAEPFKKKHLSISNFSTSLNYKYPKTKQQFSFEIKERVRSQHGVRILRKINHLSKQFLLELEPQEGEGLIKDDVIYVQFFSEWGYKLNFDQLHDKSKKRYQIISIKKENHPINSELQRYCALVMMNKGGVSYFIKRVEQYITKNTVYKGEDTGSPVGNKLIANIEDLQIATLEAFWTDYQHYAFPNRNEETWWEVWFRKKEDTEKKVLTQLKALDIEISDSRLEFGEHIVTLIRGTATQLSNSLLLLDNLMELRKPQEMNDFITDQSITSNDKKEWLQNLIERTDINLNEKSVLVCLLDTGINNNHSLINNIIPDSHLYAYKPSWGTNDTEPNGGHGTGMSGLTLYGDLTDALSTESRINIYHGVESFKIKKPSGENDKLLFGSIYKEACSIPIIDRPLNPRVFCLSITNDGFAFYGRPSAHSAAIDSIAFGENENPELFFVSGGTLIYSLASEYPDRNFIESIQDPGQAYNAVTVGSYTIKDKLSSNVGNPITRFGGMSPNNSTSATWENQWANKPDIVLEGGNLSSDGINLWQRDELKPLSIDKEYPKYTFLPFDGTCSATAFAAKMAAELKTIYPQYWPETIRGLMIHSAEWTNEMLTGRNLKIEADRRALIRSVGYGVPNLDKALYSANNSLTLISENYITPYQLNKSNVSYNQFHLYALPWPKDVLKDIIAENDVRITVTLSYFIEPNPGHRQYSNSFSYHSHNLDFKLIKPTESIEEFKRRISSANKETDEEKPDLKSENWIIRERVRSKGSIKKDYLDTNGIELSQRFYLAIYPKSGWYRSRKALNKYKSEVRYSLIVSIETPNTDIDIYTSVETQIQTPIIIESS